MRRRVAIFLAAALAFVAIALAQVPGQGLFYLGGEDPWWRPLNPQGQSYGVTVGATRPSPAMPGELFLDMDGGADGGPILELWDATNSEWDDVSSEALSGLTDNTVPVYESATGGFIDSVIVDDATDVTITTTTLNLTATTVDMTTAGLAFTTGGVLTADADFDIQAVGVTHISADGSATADALAFGASQTDDVQLYFTGTNFQIDADASASNSIVLLPGSSGIVHLNGGGGLTDILYDAANATNTGFNVFEIEVLAVSATDGSDEINMLMLDWNETDWATATEVWNAIKIDDITQDAQGTYNGINFGANLDNELYFTEATKLRIPDSGIFAIGDDGNDEAYFGLDTTNGTDTVVFAGTAWGAGDYFTIEPTWQAGTQAGDAFVLKMTAIALTTAVEQRYMILDITNANHSDTSSAIIGFDIETITGDAEGTEIPFRQNGSGALKWDLGAQFDAAVELNTYRQDFDGSCWRFEKADATAELVSDGGVNGAVCDGGIKNFTYRLELAQASPFLPSVTGQGLDIDNDGADNAGVEILAAHSLDGTADSSYYIRGQSPAMYFRVNVTIASVSGTDDMVMGWRLQEAFDATATSTNYNTFAVHKISDNAGNLQIVTDVNAVGDGVDENDVQATFADGETHTFEVQLSTSCVATFYTNGAAVTITNANDACEAGDIMLPFIMQRNATDADTETVINWIEIGEVL